MNRLNLHDGPAQAVGQAYPGLAESLWENLIELFHSDLDWIPPLHGTPEPNP